MNQYDVRVDVNIIQPSLELRRIMDRPLSRVRENDTFTIWIGL